MNCITLMDQAIAKLEGNNLPFIDKTETALGFLRSKGVLPINRASMNGHLRTSYGAMLVESHKQGTTVDVPTRKQSDLHELGLTTMIIKWFDTAVEPVIKAMRDSGNTWDQIVKHMNELSIPTAKGSKWHGKIVLNAHQRLT